MKKNSIQLKKGIREIKRNEMISLFLDHNNDLRGFTKENHWCYFVENFLNLKFSTKEKNKIIKLNF